jgi:hypothetical protein
LKLKKLFFTLLVVPVLLLGACSKNASDDPVEEAEEDLENLNETGFSDCGGPDYDSFYDPEATDYSQRL